MAKADAPTELCVACKVMYIPKATKGDRICKKCLELLPAHLKARLDFCQGRPVSVVGLMTACCLAIRKRVKIHKAKALTKAEQKRAEALTRGFTRCKNFEQLIRCERFNKWAPLLFDAPHVDHPEELLAAIEELARFYDREQKARNCKRRSWFHYQKPLGRKRKRNA